MGIETLAGIPDKFNAGDTVIFTERFTDFPNGTWTAKLWLNIWAGAPTSITATNSGDDFLFTVSATVSAAIAAGSYEYSIIVTSGSTQATPKSGTIAVLSNFATTLTPSFAQAQVTILQTAIAALSATKNESVSFNGQSFTRSRLKEYQEQLVFWMSRVAFDQDKVNALRGTPNQHLVGVRFTPAPGAGASPWTTFPFNA